MLPVIQDSWKQRQRDAKQIRAALKESGQQADLISENTGAQSMSLSRRQGSSRAQQNGSSSRPEQEAQSVRVSSQKILAYSAAWHECMCSCHDNYHVGLSESLVPSQL